MLGVGPGASLQHSIRSFDRPDFKRTHHPGARAAAEPMLGYQRSSTRERYLTRTVSDEPAQSSTERDCSRIAPFRRATSSRSGTEPVGEVNSPCAGGTRAGDPRRALHAGEGRIEIDRAATVIPCVRVGLVTMRPSSRYENNGEEGRWGTPNRPL